MERCLSFIHSFIHSPIIKCLLTSYCVQGSFQISGILQEKKQSSWTLNCCLEGKMDNKANQEIIHSVKKILSMKDAMKKNESGYGGWRVTWVLFILGGQGRSC